jgi:hypothetical protein
VEVTFSRRSGCTREKSAAADDGAADCDISRARFTEAADAPDRVLKYILYARAADSSWCARSLEDRSGRSCKIDLNKLN